MQFILSSHVCAAELDENQSKVSADFKLVYGIFVPVAHRLLMVVLKSKYVMFCDNVTSANCWAPECDKSGETSGT
jgi:hypothetical protein